MAFLLPFLLNWKTTAAGAGLLVHGLTTKNPASILGGIGLILAQDQSFLPGVTPISQ